MLGSTLFRKLAIEIEASVSAVRSRVYHDVEVPYVSFLTTNFGDRLNHFFIKKISGLRPRLIDVSRLNYVSENEATPNYLFIGSILQHARKNSVVWGAGFMGRTHRVAEKPKEILAVRGPMSRQNLLSQGLECPQIYGDPALLMPRLYQPRVAESKSQLGLIPHYVDARSFSSCALARDPRCRLINIRDTPTAFIDNVLACQVIASSSLHGLIIAHAYGIPAIWLKSDGDIGGGDFKFLDFYASIGVLNPTFRVLGPGSTVEEMCSSASAYSLSVDLDALYRSCPILPSCSHP